MFFRFQTQPTTQPLIDCGPGSTQHPAGPLNCTVTHEVCDGVNGDFRHCQPGSERMTVLMSRVVEHPCFLDGGVGPIPMCRHWCPFRVQKRDTGRLRGLAEARQGVDLRPCPAMPPRTVSLCNLSTC